MVIPIFSFDIGNYDETLNRQIRDMVLKLFGVGNYFEDLLYQQIIANFILFTNDELKIRPKTRVEEIFICFLHNPDAI
jgi:hypothetical protein